MTEKLIDTAQTIVRGLNWRKPHQLFAPPYSRQAAVLILLLDQGREVEILFTKRSSQLLYHPDQISFPGGTLESRDNNNLMLTALRETCEEIGVCEGTVKIVAQLDQIITVTNFLVTPYLGLLDPAAHFTVNPQEVAYLVLVPLSKVLDRRYWRQHEISCQGMRLKQNGLAYAGEIIWGMTARILNNLSEVLGDSIEAVIQAAKLEKDIDNAS